MLTVNRAVFVVLLDCNQVTVPLTVTMREAAKGVDLFTSKFAPLAMMKFELLLAVFAPDPDKRKAPVPLTVKVYAPPRFKIPLTSRVFPLPIVHVPPVTPTVTLEETVLVPLPALSMPKAPTVRVLLVRVHPAD